MKEIKENLRKHLEAHPQATEEDAVKFVFQGMLGVGHLVASPGEAKSPAAANKKPVPPDRQN